MTRTNTELYIDFHYVINPGGEQNISLLPCVWSTNIQTKRLLIVQKRNKAY